MELAPKAFLIRRCSSVADAKRAYFEGAFERCLQLCADIRVSTLTTASEVALLTSRAYLRTGRPREAQQTISGTRATHITLDARLTAQMLEATALIGQDNPQAGVTILLEAARDSSEAHFAIRSEIALGTAFGYWAAHDIDSADKYLQLVDPRADIIHARALELQARCYTSRRDYRRSAEFFRLTVLRLEACAARDDALAASTLGTLSIFAAELFDREIAHFVAQRVSHIAWSPSSRSNEYVVLEQQALFHAFAGNTLRAYELAAQAQTSASTIASNISGWALQAVIARDAGERYCATVFTHRARELLRTLDARSLNGEERSLLLSVAECCAWLLPDEAAHLLTCYQSLPVAPRSASDDPRPRAHAAFVAGVVAQARDERDHAARCFRTAFDSFRDLGYVRRAALAAVALLKIGELGELDDVRSYLAAQLEGVTNFATRSLDAVPSQIAARKHAASLASLTQTQRDVVELVCSGKTNREIARLRNVGEQTIKNLLTTSIFPAFGVANRAALIGSFLRERQA